VPTEQGMAETRLASQAKGHANVFTPARGEMGNYIRFVRPWRDGNNQQGGAKETERNWDGSRVSMVVVGDSTRRPCTRHAIAFVKLSVSSLTELAASVWC